LLQKDYTNFSVNLFCDKEAQAGYTVGYSYSLSKFVCKAEKSRKYRKDDSLPQECQQKFSDSELPSYKRSECGKSRTKDRDCYDRGHIIARSHVSQTSESLKEADYVTNVFPQSSDFNQDGGGWFETDQIIDCHRENPEVKRVDIFGGLLYNDESNDFFIDSYGIPTPDLYYRVVVKYFEDDSTPDVIAWLMKNQLDQDSKQKLNQRYNEENDEQGGYLIKVQTLRTVLEKKYNQIQDSNEVKILKRKLMNDLFSSYLPSDGSFTEKAFDRNDSWAFLDEKQCNKLNSNRPKCSEVERDEF